MVVAPIAAGRGGDLRALLDSMNASPGIADPDNALLPFGAFESLHFARFVILDDPTLGDLAQCGVAPPVLPVYLAFMGDCDGPARACLADLAQRAAAGLRRVLAHCTGFDAAGDLLDWLLARDVAPAASYVNWVGRTVRQVREDSALQRALAARVDRSPVTSEGEAQKRHRELAAYVAAEQRAGRLGLTPPAPTPLGWVLANACHAIAVPLAGLAILPFVVLLLPFAIVLLRAREARDPEICPRPDSALLLALRRLEDHDVTNAYTALGSVKPGIFRRALLAVLLFAVDYTCRHLYTRGFLARVQTIHFARWVFLDGGRRVAFASNYDGGHEAYMDDFINKVAWGLNLLFSNGVGYPATRWLVQGGARREGPFKNYQRRHQLPTQVWYKAYPGLTLADIARNQRIRAGLEAAAPSAAQALAWLRLL